MSASKRQRILEIVLQRLQAIRVEDDFQTDAGQQVFLGETPKLGPHDPDVAVAVVVQDDQPGYQGENILIGLPLEIQAIAKATPDLSYAAAEAVLADIKKAIELEDRSLGGLVPRTFRRGPTHSVERAEGSTEVGVGITYLFPYLEIWGEP